MDRFFNAVMDFFGSNSVMRSISKKRIQNVRNDTNPDRSEAEQRLTNRSQTTAIRRSNEQRRASYCICVQNTAQPWIKTHTSYVVISHRIRDFGRKMEIPMVIVIVVKDRIAELLMSILQIMSAL